MSEHEGFKIICPKCGAARTCVIDSRADSNGLHVRRRRKCLKCRKRFTTYEVSVDEYEQSVIQARAVKDFLDSLTVLVKKIGLDKRKRQ